MKNIYRSTITHNIAAFICGLCLLFVMLTVSLQAVCYWIPDWWRNEYAKYDTPSNVRGEMSLVLPTAGSSSSRGSGHAS